MNRAIPWVLLVLSILFNFFFCKNKEIVRIKEVKGVFRDTIIKHDTIINTSPTRVVWKNRQILVYKRIDTTSVKNYILMDSIEKLRAYIDSNSICEYSNTREDSLVRINVSGKVKSSIESMDISYVIKSREIKLDKRKFNVSLGIESSIATTLIIKPSIHVELNDKHSFSYSYDNNNRHWVGYRRKIF